MFRSLINFLLIVLLFVSTLGFVAYQSTKPAFLVAQAQRVHLYQQITGQIGNFIPKDSLKGLPLSSDQMSAVMTSAVDASTFYSLLAGVAASYLDYLTGRTAIFHYSLNLQPVKAKIITQGSSAVIAQYQALPLCQSSQLKGWDAKNSFPSCQLPPTNLQSRDVNQLLGAQITNLVGQLPDRYTAPAASEGLKTARDRVSALMKMVRLSWLVTTGLVLLTLAIWRRRAFAELAVIFLIAGLLEVAFSLVAWDWLKRLIVDLINHPGQSQALVTIVGTLVDDIIQTLKTIMGNLSIITLSVGGAFLILWGFTHFGKPKNQIEIPNP